jgi:hypothetical protein
MYAPPLLSLCRAGETAAAIFAHARQPPGQHKQVRSLRAGETAAAIFAHARQPPGQHKQVRSLFQVHMQMKVWIECLTCANV